MNDEYQARERIVAAVAAKIETALFCQFYERRDPAIKYVALVAPYHAVPEVVASLAEGVSLSELAIAGIVSILPTCDDLLAACADAEHQTSYALALRDYLAGRIADQVRALCVPPLCLLQFTGVPGDPGRPSFAPLDGHAGNYDLEGAPPELRTPDFIALRARRDSLIEEADRGCLIARVEAHVCYGRDLGALTSADRDQLVQWARWPEHPPRERAVLEAMSDQELAREAYRGLTGRYT